MMRHPGAQVLPAPADPPPNRGGGGVLVLRALGLGDALTGIPALRGLKRAFPDRVLSLAVDAATGAFLVDQRIVDVVVPTHELDPLPAMAAPRLAVDLHGRGPASHDVLAALRPGRMLNFAVPGDVQYSSGPPWFAGEHEVKRWCRLVGSVGVAADPEDLLLPGAGDGTNPAGPIVLHPGAAYGSRRWPADRWAWLADRLVRGGHQVTLTGSPGERALCQRIRAATCHGTPKLTVRAGELDLSGLTQTVNRAKLVVCGDTGVAHLATALRTRSVLLFGPTPPSQWGPLIDGDLHTVLWPAQDGYRGNPHGAHVDPMLARISAENVLAATIAALSVPAA